MRYFISFVVIAVFAVIAVIVASVVHSRDKVDSFCASIRPGMNPSDLPGLAQQAGMSYGVSRVKRPGGESVGVARGHFTGDYSCEIDFNNGHVIGTRIFSD